MIMQIDRTPQKYLSMFLGVMIYKLFLLINTFSSPNDKNQYI